MKTMYYGMFVLGIAFIPISMGAMEAWTREEPLHHQTEVEATENEDEDIQEELLTIIGSDGQSFEIPLHVASNVRFIKKAWKVSDNLDENCPEIYNSINLRAYPKIPTSLKL